MVAYLNDDFDEYEERRAAPNGRYSLRIVRAEMRETQDKSDEGGNPKRPMLVIDCIITMDLDGQYCAPRLFLIGTRRGDKHHDFHIKQAKRFCEVFGLGQSALKRNPDSFDTEPLIGKKAASVLVRQQPGTNGRVYSNVRL